MRKFRRKRGIHSMQTTGVLNRILMTDDGKNVKTVHVKRVRDSCETCAEIHGRHVGRPAGDAMRARAIEIDVNEGVQTWVIL